MPGGRIHGKHGQIKMDPTGGATTVVVADLNAWTLDVSKDLVDVTCFGDTNKRSVVGLPNYTGTFGGQWNSASSPTLFDVIFGDIAPKLELIPDSLEPTYMFSGLANLDGSINCDSKGSVTITGKFSAFDNWTMAP
jgi:hypothetical protein